MVNPDVTGRNWDKYWQGTGEAGAYASGGVRHPAIVALWQQLFSEIKESYTSPRILDVATGNGALIEQALAVFADSDAEVNCLDVSPAAIGNIQARFPQVNGIVADAAHIPFNPGSFDIVTSQFGIEYAGMEAIDGASALIAPNGHLVLLLHNKEGSIYQQCQVNLEAARLLRKSGFLPLATEMFRAGFDACRGGDRAPYEAAARKLQPAVKAVESIVDKYGENVADETVARLYDDVGRIHTNIQRYEPEQVLNWLQQMEREMVAYEGRMASMCEAAIGSDGFELICDKLRERGFSASRAEALYSPDTKSPLAWVLIAGRDPDGPGWDPVGEADEAELQAIRDWAKQQLDAAVRELMGAGAIQTRFFEARPAWVLPYRILIGRVRKPFDTANLHWVICGEFPSDLLPGSVASTPREAARHFALKWQLDAERESDAQLVKNAELLYGLSEDANIWLNQG